MPRLECKAAVDRRPGAADARDPRQFPSVSAAAPACGVCCQVGGAGAACATGRGIDGRRAVRDAALVIRPVILMTGHTFDALRTRRGDFDAWFAAGAGWPLDRFEVVDAVTGPLPDPRGVDGVIVSGSAATVHERDPWSVRAGAWLAESASAGVPILGVCYGHQLLADTLGGEAGRNPNGREIGVAIVRRLADDPLFEGLPDAFPVIATHVDAVLRPPPGARVLAANENTAVQALALGANVRSVQFHPEMDADMIRQYLTHRAALVDAERGPGTAERLLAAAHDIDTGPRILANFFRNWLGVEPARR